MFLINITFNISFAELNNYYICLRIIPNSNLNINCHIFPYFLTYNIFNILNKQYIRLILKNNQVLDA
jgi:hypothetical protein